MPRPYYRSTDILHSAFVPHQHLIFFFCYDRKEVYINLKRLWAEYACHDHLEVIKDLENECGYSPDEIPQLEQVNIFLKGNSLLTCQPVLLTTGLVAGIRS